MANSPTLPSANDGTGERFSSRRFEIVRRLGEGGMGVVYEAIDREQGVHVALKTLRTFNADALLRFKNEFRALQDIHHPNLVRLGELYEEEGRWFFTMELVQGVTFLQWVRGDGKNDAERDQATPGGPGPAHAEAITRVRAAVLPDDDLAVGGLLAMQDDTHVRPLSSDEENTVANGRHAQLDRQSPAPSGRPPAARRVAFDEARLRGALAQLAQGLGALHAAAKIHRDIKPSNIMVTDTGRVVILDFGLIANIADDVLGPQRRRVGSPSHMAPEQVDSPIVGPPADWYSVGVLLYQALTGTLPHRGAMDEVVRLKQKCDPVPPRTMIPELPADLDRLAMALLSRTPAERPGGETILALLQVEAPPATSSGPFGVLGMPLIGRLRELEVLRQALDETAAGRAVTLLVHGASGVGKTALVRAFTSELTAPQALVLSGRCYERESVPYKAVDGLIDALSRHLVSAGAPTSPLPRDTALVAQVFPVMRRIASFVATPSSLRESDNEPQERRRRLFAALRELVRQLAQNRPVVLVIDDLQWADADSLALLAEVLRLPDAPRVMLVGTVRTRSDELETHKPPSGRRHTTDNLPAASDQVDVPTGGARSLHQVASAFPGEVRRLELGGLPESEAETLARLLLQKTGFAAVDAAAIASEAKGHPLFIDELLRYCQLTQRQAELADRLAQGAGTTANLVLPLRLDDALWARIEQLEPPSRQLLEVLAVAGAPLSQQLAARAVEWELSVLAERVTLLRGVHLVKTSGARLGDTIEPYHDRVREAVLAHLDGQTLRRWHERLAVTLEASHAPSAEALAIHWRGQGDRHKAAIYAAQAADQAYDALAFERAARWYRLALELDRQRGAATLALRVRLGDALANAGLGAEAAAAYLDVAHDAAPQEQLDLRRQAADQLLKSGRIDEGLAVLRSVLNAVGLEVPGSPKRALAAFLLRRLRVRLRGLAFREHSADEIAPEVLTRIDACWSVATALGLVEPISGRYFDACGLLFALDAGEPHRVTRALAVEACYSAIEGGAGQQRTAALVHETTRLAERLGHPYTLGWAQAAAGITAALEGRFRDGHAYAAAAEATFREHCTGVAWERTTVHWFSLWSLAYLGQLAELGRTVPEWLHDATGRGDLYAIISHATGLANLVWLARDTPAEARRQAEHALAAWSRKNFHVEHWWELLAQVQIDLYSGQGRAALERLEQRWQDLAGSLLLRVQLTRIEAAQLRARAALCAALETEPGRQRQALLKAAEKDASSVLDEHMPWSDPLARLLQAALASQRGANERAAALLEQAITGCQAAGLLLYEAAARYRAGQLRGDATGQTLCTQAQAWMEAEGVVCPARMVAMLAPGFIVP